MFYWKYRRKKVPRQIKYNNNIYNIIADRDDIQEECFYASLIAQEAEYWVHHLESFTKNDFEFICSRRGFNEAEIQSLKELCLFLELPSIWE
jgi:hypothetical protein